MYWKVHKNTKIFQSRSGQFSEKMNVTINVFGGKVHRNTKSFQLRSGQFSEKMNVIINVFGELREI